MTRRRILIAVLLALAACIVGMLYLVGLAAPEGLERRRAFGIAGMTTGLFVLWVLLAGGAMWHWRDAACRLVRRVPIGRGPRFVLFCTGLACLEEAVTVGMTNLAPLFGARVGEAFITASTNWLDVIALHSVVVFVPYFIVLALILRRWAFSPFAVFVSFGMVGTVGEAIFAGNLAMVLTFPLWLFVYGLMVWLPAYCLQAPAVRPVGVLGHLILPPALFMLAMPMVGPLVWLITGVLDHPPLHFPQP